MCRALGVSTSGFYAWQRRPQSSRARTDRRLCVYLRAAHQASGGSYGNPPAAARSARPWLSPVGRKRTMRWSKASSARSRAISTMSCGPAAMRPPRRSVTTSMPTTTRGACIRRSATAVRHNLNGSTEPRHDSSHVSTKTDQDHVRVNPCYSVVLRFGFSWSFIPCSSVAVMSVRVRGL